VEWWGVDFFPFSKQSNNSSFPESLPVGVNSNLGSRGELGRGISYGDYLGEGFGEFFPLGNPGFPSKGNGGSFDFSPVSKLTKN
jgi:hypothetical protein